MESASLGLYLVASMALIVTPGQDMLYVISRSLAQGRLAGVCSAIGVCLGILVHTALAALGVGAILMASEALFLALKLVGAAYLVYLGIRLLFSREAAPPAAGSAPPLAPLALVWQGMLSNVTNPKIVMFFFAFLPQFVSPASAHPTRDLVFLGVLYALLALPVKAAVGLGAGSLSERVIGRPGAMRWINRASGSVLIALGLRLAAAERR
ncbi:MAG: LysE family translocator [Pseudomonadota bacterium]|nr:LysE family translocator [Pseudomonadota bacterium]